MAVSPATAPLSAADSDVLVELPHAARESTIAPRRNAPANFFFITVFSFLKILFFTLVDFVTWARQRFTLTGFLT